jgi:signal peptidase II
MTPKLKVFLALFAITFVSDQASKHWVVEQLFFGARQPVIDGLFYLTHVRNPGAAFSMFADMPEAVRKIFFPATTVLAIAMILSFFAKLAPRDRLSGFALGAILGGALGNLVDRLRFGEVIDFLHLEFRGSAFPDFNLADSFIVIGVALLILELFTAESEAGAAPRGSGEERPA